MAEKSSAMDLRESATRNCESDRGQIYGYWTYFDYEWRDFLVLKFIKNGASAITAVLSSKE